MAVSVEQVRPVGRGLARFELPKCPGAQRIHPQGAAAQETGGEKPQGPARCGRPIRRHRQTGFIKAGQSLTGSAVAGEGVEGDNNLFHRGLG